MYDKDLYDGIPKTLGSVSAFLTVYGVIFALIELARTRSAAELAEQKASHVVSVIEDLMTAREISECQAAVESALEGIGRGEGISGSHIVRIIRLYSRVFPLEMKSDNSPHRRNRTILESYEFSAAEAVKGGVPKKTKRALLEISGHLAQEQGQTKYVKEKIA
ncbi:hypothetical protein A7D16_05785 [Xanthomonas nasturtii]|nr:hypothetical protein [Xanthomonas nasturtii]OAX85789.1 hypothetical protein A7D16_05785 [Xanthomonas nasturtii]WVL58474.1 hypothetical protein M3O54_009835 [Xanthomonas nasturtii]